MKIIKYRKRIIVPSSNEHEQDKEIFYNIKSPWNSRTEEIAKREAYNGEYTIEDDGEPEPGPSQLDRIEAQAAYTAMMTDTLLEG